MSPRCAWIITVGGTCTINGVRIGSDGLIKDHYHIFMLKEG